MINISTISFFLALLGILGMVSFGQSLSKFTGKTDRLIETVYSKIRLFISHINRHTAIALVQWIAYHVLSWIRSLYIRVHRKAHAHPHSKKVIDMVRGKGEVEKNGGASFYLKSIGEEN